MPLDRRTSIRKYLLLDIERLQKQLKDMTDAFADSNYGVLAGELTQRERWLMGEAFIAGCQEYAHTLRDERMSVRFEQWLKCDVADGVTTEMALCHEVDRWKPQI